MLIKNFAVFSQDLSSNHTIFSCQDSMQCFDKSINQSAVNLKNLLNPTGTVTTARRITDGILQRVDRRIITSHLTAVITSHSAPGEVTVPIHHDSTRLLENNNTPNLEQDLTDIRIPATFIHRMVMVMVLIVVDLRDSSTTMIHLTNN